MRYILAAVFTFICAFTARAEEPRKPNIVFILADDLGYTDVACFGSKYYETPNIDRLAKNGVRFTSGYTCGPNCQPTRRTHERPIRSTHRHLYGWRNRSLRLAKPAVAPVDNVTELPLDKITIADTLKKAGYATAMFGKWHLGTDPKHHPNKRGFDEAIESSGVHFNFKTNPPTDYPKGQYLADFLTDHAVDFIERHHDQPFFLYLPHYAVHAPHEAKKELIAKFKEKTPVGGHKNPAYAAMIASVDESVGRVVATLDKLGLTENTLVIFASDNGGVGGYERFTGLNKNGVTDNAPLKGGKGMLYEGGVRVPYIFSWKGKIAPDKENTTPINSVDLYPTLVEITGAEKPHDYTLDGESYASLLTGAKSKLDRDAIYWHFPGYLGAGPGQWRTKPGGSVHAGDFKLIEFFEDGQQELYNLKDDIGEEHNLAKENPEKVKELHAKLVAWREKVGAKMPTPNTEEKSDVKRPKKKKKAAKNRGEDD